jgi:hypothetical protein
MPTVASAPPARRRAPLARALGASSCSSHGVRPCRAQAAPPGSPPTPPPRAAAARRDWGGGRRRDGAGRAGRAHEAEYHYWLGKAYAEQARPARSGTRARLARRVLDAWERALALDSTYDARTRS